MASTRYRPARTLVRKLTRLPLESPRDFKEKVRKLRLHFQQFNRDASLLCQWLMAVRPPQPDSPAHDKRSPRSRNFDLTEETRGFWEFFLDPTASLPPSAEASGRDREDSADKLRLALMDYIIAEGDAALPELPPELAASVRATKQHPRTMHASTAPIFARLREIAAPHREVLLKAAAEWVNARYKRPMDRWPDQHKHWSEERDKWQAEHPSLTDEAKQAFDTLFQQIGADQEPAPLKKQVTGLANLGQLAGLHASTRLDPEQTQRAIRSSRPRICTLERMQGGLNNCEHNGERCGDIRHGPLCVKYFSNFEPLLKARPAVKDAKDPGKAFGEAKRSFAPLAQSYLAARAQGRAEGAAMAQVKESERASVRRRASKGKEGKPPEQTELRTKVELAKFDAAWNFNEDWAKYLTALGITDGTAVRSFRDAGNTLPHCTDRKGVDRQCHFNPHTELCRAYKRVSADLAPLLREKLISLEKDYREWRVSYRRAPKRPQFNYPSAKLLPMPKIFGAGYWLAHFGDSTVTLTLETGEQLKFGFTPWPKKSGKKPYSPQPPKDKVVSSFDKDIFTSIHVYFVGTRPRIGFRFEVPHAPGRIAFSQDAIDELRSRKYPRAHQDRKFLQEARQCVLENFASGADAAQNELRVLAVDLGQVAAAYALFVGKKFKDQPSGRLEIVKLENLKEQYPVVRAEDGTQEPDYSRGLNKEHVVRHLNHAAKVASRVRTWRNKKFGEDDPKAEVGEHDQRGRFRHVSRMMQDWVRLNVRRIIEKAEGLKADVIVLDSSRRPMVPARDNPDLTQKQRKAYRAFGQIRHKLREKAVERGMRVLMVPEGRTSEACHQCGQPGNTKQKKARIFKCKNPNCAVHKAGTFDSEINAALVLGRVFWGEIDPEQAKLDAEAQKAARKLANASGEPPHAGSARGKGARQRPGRS